MMRRTTSKEVSRLREIGCAYGTEIHMRVSTQIPFHVTNAANLLAFCSWLREEGFSLVTIAANDERRLEENCYKIYFVFSHPNEDLFLTIEHPLEAGKEQYVSIRRIFPAAIPFEREIADLFGLEPDDPALPVEHGTVLHGTYPSGVLPLRRDAMLSEGKGIPSSERGVIFSVDPLQDGEVLVPVGPIHAGVIEPGVFALRSSGEVVEGMRIGLGFAHKGIERLFQERFRLADGWRLAQAAAGDTPFCHSLAYCHAVEAICGVEVPTQAQIARALFLELERIHHHLGACGGLAEDTGFALIATELSALREDMMRLNGALAGNRFLKGINRPGGAILREPLVVGKVQSVVQPVVERSIHLAQVLIEHPDFRERTIGLGILPVDTARQLGVTGLAARASGIHTDYRVQHPFGPYRDQEVQAILRGEPLHEPPVSVLPEQSGDVFRRFVQRVLEISIAGKLIACFLQDWKATAEVNFMTALQPRQVLNYEDGLGWAEGPRGEVVYWVMKDTFERIYRCKVRDPSTLNWSGLAAAVLSGQRSGETTLADFPIINKSFQLSYSGSDL